MDAATTANGAATTAMEATAAAHVASARVAAEAAAAHVAGAHVIAAEVASVVAAEVLPGLRWHREAVSLAAGVLADLLRGVTEAIIVASGAGRRAAVVFA